MCLAVYPLPQAIRAFKSGPVSSGRRVHAVSHLSSNYEARCWNAAGSLRSSILLRQHDRDDPLGDSWIGRLGGMH